MVKTAYAARTGYAVAFTEDLSKSAVGYIVNDRYMMSAFPAMLMVGLVGGRLCHAAGVVEVCSGFLVGEKRLLIGNFAILAPP